VILFVTQQPIRAANENLSLLGQNLLLLGHGPLSATNASKHFLIN